MRKSTRGNERISTSVFAVCAGLVVVTMAAIFVFVGANAYQTFTSDHVNPIQFFTTANWNPDGGTVGSLVLILGTAVTTLFALILATPISVGVAIFVTEIAPPWARQLMQPVLELLTGIPSIIFGFLGLIVLVPFLRNVLNGLVGGFVTVGFGVFAAAITLTIMILPTITTLSIDALAALPGGLREGSLALGATRWQTIRRTLVPAASSGIFTGIILGMGRAIGETLAVSLVIGSNPNSFPIRFTSTYPYVFFPSSSTITAQLLSDFREAVNPSLDYHAIWTLAFVLLVISFVLVVIGRRIAARGVYGQSTGTRAPREAAPVIAVATRGE
jgi:phosphate transport system permease protein